MNEVFRFVILLLSDWVRVIVMLVEYSS